MKRIWFVHQIIRSNEVKLLIYFYLVLHAKCMSQHEQANSVNYSLWNVRGVFKKYREFLNFSDSVGPIDAILCFA